MPDFFLFVPTLILVAGVAIVLIADLLPFPDVKRWVALASIGTALAVVLSMARTTWPINTTLFTWLSGYDGMAPVVYNYYFDAISYGLLVVSLFAALVLVLYASHYVTAEPRRQLVLYCVVLVSGAAFTNLVLAGNILVAYIGLQIWVIVSSASMMFWHHGSVTTPAAVRSFLLAGLPSTGVLVGAIALTGQNLSQSFMPAGPQSVPWVLLFGFLLAAAAVSYQYPFHPWTAVNLRIPLPAAALLGMVFAPWAGIYLLERSQSLFGLQVGVQWHQSLMAIGALTMVAGVIYTLKQTHLRGITVFLATVQLGYAFVGFSMNTPASVAAALLIAVNCTLASCGMMICAGIIERSTGTGNVIKLGRLVEREPRTALLFALFSLTLAGVPFPTLGFVAKWMIFGAAVEANHVAFGILTIVVDFLIFVTLLRAFDWVFFRRRFSRAAYGSERERLPLISAGLLAIPIVIFGFVPFVLIDWLVGPAVEMVTQGLGLASQIPLPTGMHGAGFLTSAFTFVLMALPTLLGSIAYMVAVDGHRSAQPASAGQRVALPGKEKPAVRAAVSHASGWFPWVMNTTGVYNSVWRMFAGVGAALRKLFSPTDTSYSPMAILLAALAVVLSLLE
ncbi:MAG: proton-conducting transporter membrane subunit [Dehalococcoidia bacterium]|nr:proton-conducting transporter membrane subunit [Dehalococcoidia bacterium]